MNFELTFVPDIHQLYDAKRGYGFAIAAMRSKTEDMRDSWPGDYFEPMVPSLLIDVPNGNYEVKLTIGSDSEAADVTVKEGLGRLKVYSVTTDPGETITKSFAVHVQDGQLKLAFAGKSPIVQQVSIRRDASIPTIFLTGDSTVTDQPSGHFPYTGWGQMIGLFLNEKIAVANHACSGRSSKSFIVEARLNRVAKKLHKGDYLAVQFAHNDEKEGEMGTDPFTTYQQYLKQYIELAREKEAYPILIAPMHRRVFHEDGSIENTHGEYIEAMRQLAIEESVPFVDLAALSKIYFEQLGVELTKRIFLWTKAGEYDYLPEGTEDNTHFREYGAFQIARLITEGVTAAGIEPLSQHLIPATEINELQVKFERNELVK